jgi:glycosyltransferase involved in cell wall biosynthesis
VRVAVVVPVRNAGQLLDECLAGVAEQARAMEGEVVVVDDASEDDPAAGAARHGARLIRLSSDRGPYAARNVGWRATQADVVVFTDARCRPQTGSWLERLVATASRPGVAVAGGDVTVAPGHTTAERWAERDGRLRVRRHLEEGWLPYVPTANMAVPRRVLDSLGGFREVRSGGDVDLCWRAQLAGLGDVVEAPGAGMVAVPRAGAREVLRQWRRYAHGHVALWSTYAERGCPVPPPESAASLTREALRATAGVALRRRRDPAVEALEQARRIAYAVTYRRALRHRSGSAA